MVYVGLENVTLLGSWVLLWISGSKNLGRGLPIDGRPLYLNKLIMPVV